MPAKRFWITQVTGSRCLKGLLDAGAIAVRRKAAVPVITFDGHQFCLSPAPGRDRVRAQDAVDKTVADPCATVVRGVDQAIQSIFPDETVGTRPAAGHERPAKSRPPQRVGRLSRRASPRGSGAAEGAQR